MKAYSEDLTARCSRVMIESDAEGWRTFAFREAQRDILQAALHSEDKAAQRTAADIINLLGSRGHFDFKDLLQELKDGTKQ